MRAFLQRGARRLRHLGRNLLRRPRVERELDDEIRGFEAMLGDEHRAGGMDAVQARRAAALALGGPGGAELVKGRVRDARRGAFMETLWQDVRYGARMLARNPGVAAVAILVLALGIGANTAMFSLVGGVLLRPLPYPDAGRVEMVYMDFAPQNNPRGTMCIADYLAWRGANHAFLDPALFQSRTFDLSGGARPEQRPGARVTSGFFSTLEVAPMAGRVLLPRDDQPSSLPVVVVGESFWRRQLGARPDAIGAVVKLDGVPYTIVGIMPAQFHFPQETSEIWANLPLVTPSRLGPYFYHGLGRLKPGVSVAAAQAETNAIGRRLQRDHPGYYHHLTLPVVELREATVGRIRLPLLVLMGAVALVLLIAIVNVACLLLARAQSRQPEMAIRVSLGAGAPRLLRQLLTESLMLALAGGAVGVGLAYAALIWFRNANPGGLPRMENVRLDGGVLAATFAASLVAGVLFGLAPAWQAARAAGRTSAAGLAARGARAAGRARGGARSALVTAEIALALVLLCGAGVLLRSFAQLERTNTGVHAPGAQTFATAVSLSGPAYDSTAAGADSPAGLAFDRNLLARVRQIPGVAAAALSDSLPPQGESDDDTFTIRGQAWTAADFPSVPDAIISPGYFQTLGVPLLAGRDFSADDTATSTPVIIVSQAVARRHFPTGSPLGHYIKDAEPSLTQVPYDRIVGVVGDVDYQGIGATPEAVYRPVAQNFSRFTQIVLRSPLPASNLAPALRQAVRGLDPDAVVMPTRSLDDLMAEAVGPQRFQALLLALFALLALVLATTGIYGVVAYGVTRRTHEIGVRIALGATSRQILAQVLGEGMRLALLGVAVGLAGALALTRLLAGLLFHLSPDDPVTFAAMSAALIAVAMVASLVPARRATRIAPLAALRRE